jgi:hypothetical protein
MCQSNKRTPYLHLNRQLHLFNTIIINSSKTRPLFYHRFKQRKKPRRTYEHLFHANDSANPFDFPSRQIQRNEGARATPRASSCCHLLCSLLCGTQKQCDHCAVERSTHQCSRPSSIIFCDGRADGKTSTSSNSKYVICKCKRSSSVRPVLSHPQKNFNLQLCTFLREFYDSINLKAFDIHQASHKPL